MRAYHIRVSLHIPKTESEFIPKNIFQTFPAHKAQSTSRRKASVHPKQADYRLGPIRIDWADLTVSMNAGKAKERKRGPVTASFVPKSEQNVATGSTNLPEGIVHLYRESDQESKRLSTSLETVTTIPAESEDGGVTLAVLAVPAYMSPSDFLAFAAPAGEGMSHVRIIKDSAPDRSMVVIKFRQASDASDFIEVYNGRPFNAMEPEICNVVRVASISFDVTDATAMSIVQLDSSQGASFELPTCPVCLERMDTAITGLVTVPCSHTFHCMCLSKWGDSRCPVCRYSQTLMSSHAASTSTNQSPGPANPTAPTLEMSTCFTCPSTNNLWICLICGNVGCGRYGRAHAQAHFELTTHVYSMELETQRVWDYAGDGYVHRLIQNRADGKLVELPSAVSSAATHSGRGDGSQGPSTTDALNAEKIEAIGIEYSYLLTSQLESQRAYYEERTAELTGQVSSLKDMTERLSAEVSAERASAAEERALRLRELDLRENELLKAKAKAEQRAEKATEIARKMSKDLMEEKAVSEGLMRNLKETKEKNVNSTQQQADLQKRIQDLEDQLRDVMFFLDAKSRIEQEGTVASEAAGGSVEVITPATPKKKKGKK
ncbi:hypothetical protein BDV98DRAFT_561985 [Pterulicium gracile]|uniref:BRCA1-associated protein 2-domain-containing protein n=1 Tax=Pterulicium gracile TaxID=1884261 RepID=A0A5C3QY12_9AGAR|nr:hypothetical protein BDV98DRAFT_561985 [Pterula gracilis]